MLRIWLCQFTSATSTTTKINIFQSLHNGHILAGLFIDDEQFQEKKTYWSSSCRCRRTFAALKIDINPASQILLLQIFPANYFTRMLNLSNEIVNSRIWGFYSNVMKYSWKTMGKKLPRNKRWKNFNVYFKKQYVYWYIKA